MLLINIFRFKMLIAITALIRSSFWPNVKRAKSLQPATYAKKNSHQI